MRTKTEIKEEIEVYKKIKQNVYTRELGTGGLDNLQIMYYETIIETLEWVIDET